MIATLTQPSTNRILRSLLLIVFIILQPFDQALIIYAEVAVIATYILLTILALTAKTNGHGPIIEQQAISHKQELMVRTVLAVFLFAFLLYYKYL